MMDELERQSLIGRYGEGLREVLAAMAAVGDGGLDEAAPGEWSPRMVVHHLADTEAFRSVRLRQLLAYKAPVIQAFDELALAERLHYDRPISASLALVKAAVEANLELVSRMSDEDWARYGHHTEEGDFSMDEWLRRAANHLHEHAAQVRASWSQ